MVRIVAPCPSNMESNWGCQRQYLCTHLVTSTTMGSSAVQKFGGVSFSPCPVRSHPCTAELSLFSRSSSWPLSERLAWPLLNFLDRNQFKEVLQPCVMWSDQSFFLSLACGKIIVNTNKNNRTNHSSKVSTAWWKDFFLLPLRQKFGV